MIHAPSKMAESGVHETAAEVGRFLENLPELISAAARETSQSDVALRIAREFVGRLGARTARVYLVCSDGCALHLAAAYNVVASSLAKTLVVNLDDEFPACAAVRLGLLQLVSADDEATFGRAPRPGGMAVAVPLFAGTLAVGALIAGFDEMTPRDCVTLRSLSHALGALLDRARLGGELERSETRIRVLEERTALVVHDLRQPLTGVLLAGANLERGGYTAGQRSLVRLRACGLHLSRMISNLCDAVFLESDNFVLQRAPSDIVALVREVVREHCPSASVSVVGDIPWLSVDAPRVEQVLANLLWNAARHGDADAPVDVGVVARESRVVVSVTNEGDGIALDERARVFEAHSRGRRCAPGTTGLGLGLYICSKLVEGHGGRIWVDGLGRKTRFSFSLPLTESGMASGSERSVTQ